jgi:hypothetical protein
MTDFGVYAPPKVPNPTTSVQTITRFNLTINAKTAKALEITMPPRTLTHRRSNRMNLQLLHCISLVMAQMRSADRL